MLQSVRTDELIESGLLVVDPAASLTERRQAVLDAAAAFTGADVDSAALYTDALPGKWGGPGKTHGRIAIGDAAEKGWVVYARMYRSAYDVVEVPIPRH